MSHNNQTQNNQDLELQPSNMSDNNQTQNNQDLPATASSNISHNNQTQNYKKRFKKLQKLVTQQEGRIHNLQNSAFQLANYYFVFQGVILAAVFNTTSLRCSEAVFVFLLSFIAAILNLSALFSIGSKYIRAMASYEENLSERNGVFQKLHDDSNEDQTQNRQTQNRDDSTFSQIERRVVLYVCIILFSAFTLITLVGTWFIICKRDRNNGHVCNKLGCVKLCNGSKCMALCHAG